MASVPVPGNGAADSVTELIPPRRARGYQLEMLEESMRQNVIVAMDTGSGKTEIAILRIQKELDRCSVDKLVWFIAPTVALAEQQHSVISKQLPAFQTRLLTGADKVDHWSTKAIWDSILLNIRIVVTTPQVLLDALSNGFLNLDRIALLIFDEAHHCVSEAPASKIMRNFYHYRLQQDGNTDKLPHILGLTASPITSGCREELERLENNLNAVCVAPKMHREEMMQFVYMPTFYNIKYSLDFRGPPTKADRLLWLIENLNIEDDPFVRFMREKNDPKSQKKLMEALEKNKTPCLIQLRRCYNRSIILHAELGCWAADTFLALCLKSIMNKYANKSNKIEMKWTDWGRQDVLYISKVLSQLDIPAERQRWTAQPNEISTKVHRLVDFLEKEHVKGSAGIIFAKERTTVIMLTRLISMHPRLSHVRAAAVLGSSAFATRKSDITELHDLATQSTAIDDLRSGKKNLIIATSVLEEGIDVPACDAVICFDLPQNLRSFVQRRGRARKKGSKFAIFVDASDTKIIAELQSMEETMKEFYLEQERVRQEIQVLENAEEQGYDGFRIPSTGALLTLENARSHLSHFCGTLSCEFTDAEPQFIIEGDRMLGRTAKVILPNFLDPKFRQFQGIARWNTEKMAKRDASFQAYVALYKAGLVNDNLMPAHRRKNHSDADQEKRPSFARLTGAYNPWAVVAKQWQEGKDCYQNLVEITAESQEFPSMLMVLPVALPCDISFKLFWNEKTTLSVSIKRTAQRLAPNLIKLARDTTSVLLSSLFAQRMVSGCLDFSYLLVPDIELMESSIEKWCQSVTGTIILKDSEEYDATAFKKLGLLRRADNTSRPWVFEDYVWRRQVLEELEGDACSHAQNCDCPEILHIEGAIWPKRTDYFHALPESVTQLHHTAKCFHPAKDCVVDKLPVPYTRFTLFVPCLIHNVGHYLVADELTRTILRPVGFSDISLLLTAISAPAARAATNYQRLEFLGDSLLKLYTTVQLAAKNLYWHEGLLSSKKGIIVSNGNLANAAIRTGLDRFILTNAFRSNKWRPSYNEDHLVNNEEPGPPRELSTKVLADVVEALIGAASVDGGHEKALSCLKVFLPDIDWAPLDECVHVLHDSVIHDDADDRTVHQLEEMLGYTFTRRPLLLAAITHPSSRKYGHSYQRLEFVGDAILDTVIVNALFESPKEFAHYDMHLMRTALVNADFLAFLCMNTYIEEDRAEAVDTPNHKVKVKMTKRKVRLWQFIDHAVSWDIAYAQQSAVEQYDKLHGEIQAILQSAKTYPWTQLCGLDTAKFFSDIIESILGAIYLDSRGSMNACEDFLRRIGLMQYLERMLSEDIDFMHPKQRLGHLANALTVEYATKRTDNTEERRWECTVRVGDEEVARLEDGISPIEAETRAAEAAVKILRAKNELGAVQAPDNDIIMSG